MPQLVDDSGYISGVRHWRALFSPSKGSKACQRPVTTPPPQSPPLSFSCFFSHLLIFPSLGLSHSPALSLCLLVLVSLCLHPVLPPASLLPSLFPFPPSPAQSGWSRG